MLDKSNLLDVMVSAVATPVHISCWAFSCPGLGVDAMVGECRGMRKQIRKGWNTIAYPKLRLQGRLILSRGIELRWRTDFRPKGLSTVRASFHGAKE
jgi:hypothetical protein